MEVFEEVRNILNNEDEQDKDETPSNEVHSKKFNLKDIIAF